MCERGFPEENVSLTPELVFPVLQWTTVRLMLIFQFILGLLSQIIDFANAFYQADIPSGGTVFIELPRGFDSDGGKCYGVLRLKKILYGRSEAARLWCESF